MLRSQSDRDWVGSLSVEQRGRFQALTPDLIESAKRTNTWENLKRSVEGAPAHATANAQPRTQTEDRQQQRTLSQMGDADLCLAALHTSVGFVPMEIQHRKLSCDDRKQEVLERLLVVAKENPFRFKADHIASVLPYKCEGLEVSTTTAPQMVERKFAGGSLSYTNPNRYVLKVRNRTSKTQYLYVRLYHDRTESDTWFLLDKLGPREEKSLPIRSEFLEPSWARDSGCYAVQA